MVEVQNDLSIQYYCLKCTKSNLSMFDHNNSQFNYSLVFWFTNLSSEVVYDKYIWVVSVWVDLFKGFLQKKKKTLKNHCLRRLAWYIANRLVKPSKSYLLAYQYLYNVLCENSEKLLNIPITCQQTHISGNASNPDSKYQSYLSPDAIWNTGNSFSFKSFPKDMT